MWNYSGNFLRKECLGVFMNRFREAKETFFFFIRAQLGMKLITIASNA